jgi:hypothetical protein
MHISVGFSTSDRWISKLICWWTQSPTSHAFISYYDEILSQEMVLDVGFTTFSLVPMSHFSQNNRIIEVFDTKVDMTTGLRVVGRWLNRVSYDWFSFVGFWKVLTRWFKRTTSWAGDLNVTPREVLCTEVVIYALRISGYPGAAELDAKGTSPKDLLEFMRK